jgi:hypothetical protein
MHPKYKIGQRVTVKTARDQRSLRDCTIEPYTGQAGKVTSYYWISPRNSDIFYIYTVKVGNETKEVALHEDEIESL